ncbi:hypothetical protein [Planomonospora algeriensis]
MPRYLLKPAPDRDFYTVYSTVVMGTVFEGTRAEVEAFHTDRDARGALTPAEAADLLARADATGTSDPDGFGGWDDELAVFCYPL